MAALRPFPESLSRVRGRQRKFPLFLNFFPFTVRNQDSVTQYPVDVALQGFYPGSVYATDRVQLRALTTGRPKSGDTECELINSAVAALGGRHGHHHVFDDYDASLAHTRLKTALACARAVSLPRVRPAPGACCCATNTGAHMAPYTCPWPTSSVTHPTKNHMAPSTMKQHQR